MPLSHAAARMGIHHNTLYSSALALGWGLVREAGEWWIPNGVVAAHYQELEKVRRDGAKRWNERMQDPAFAASIREGEEIIQRQVQEQEVARQVALKLAAQVTP